MSFVCHQKGNARLYQCFRVKVSFKWVASVGDGTHRYVNERRDRRQLELLSLFRASLLKWKGPACQCDRCRTLTSSDADFTHTQLEAGVNERERQWEPVIMTAVLRQVVIRPIKGGGELVRRSVYVITVLAQWWWWDRSAYYHMARMRWAIACYLIFSVVYRYCYYTVMCVVVL